MFLNNSGAEVAEDCLRKRFWEEEFDGNGLQSIFRNDNLDFGTIIHAGLGAYYSGSKTPTIDMLKFTKEFLQWDNLNTEERNKYAELSEWQQRMLKAYMVWAPEHDNFVPLQIEAEGCVILGEICYKCGEPYPITDTPEEFKLCAKCLSEIHHWVYRVDLAVNKGEYRPTVQIGDHKTTGSLGDTYLLSWHNSLQLWGYSYSYEKQSGIKVSGYFVNILRKLKTIGLENQEIEKVCPECHNGKKKKLSCSNCNNTGHILITKEQEDKVPFVREEEAWDEDKKEIFVRQRINTIQRIQAEKELFKIEPDVAWPMNPKSCFKMGKCPFWKLCYTPNNPEKWYLPSDDQLINFQPREPNYVRLKQMAREEMD